MYGARKTLQVTIKKEDPTRIDPGDTIVGSYTFGKIEILPCPNCAAGFLTHIFLHELCHAWLHQYHEAVYEVEDSCRFCDTFADVSYKLLAGDRPPKQACRAYRLNSQVAMQRFPLFEAFWSKQLLELDEKSVASLILGRSRITAAQ